MNSFQPLTQHENVYILDNLKNGYKLLKTFLDSKHKSSNGQFRSLEQNGMIIVNTLTTSGNIGPNLICIDSDKLANATEEQIQQWQEDKIHVLDKPDEIERKHVEDMIMQGRVQELPEGDITIWDPSKIDVMGVFFSNAAPTITIKTKSGKVGMGVLTRENITKDFFEKLKQVIGDDDEITIDVVSSTMKKYRATRDNGSVALTDALNPAESYTLPQHIANVAEKVGIHCTYKNCIDIDKCHRTFSTGEKTTYTNSQGEPKETLGNTGFLFDPGGLLSSSGVIETR